MDVLLIIDPGHGGVDLGGGSNTLWKEKNMNLKISQYQYNRFKELGIPVVMTRMDDRSIPASHRANMVKKSQAIFCLSNHINAGGGEGAELIHSIYTDDHLSRALSKEIRATGQGIRRIFTRTLPTDPKKDYYFMHRDTGQVETIIIEYGFADNKKDTEFLRNNWMDLAEAVVKGFCLHVDYPYLKKDTSEEEPTKQPSTERPMEQEASQWAKDSWEWGILNHITDGRRPLESATRQEVMTMVHRLYQLLNIK